MAIGLLHPAENDCIAVLRLKVFTLGIFFKACVLTSILFIIVFLFIYFFIYFFYFFLSLFVMIFVF